MIEIGSVVSAQVERVEPYGVYFRAADDTVLVLAPDVAWTGRVNLAEAFPVGTTRDVMILRLNYKTGEYVGSIRRLHPEDNPYRQISLRRPGEVLHGKVTGAYSNGASVRLPNGAYGNVPATELRDRIVSVGDEVEVVIRALDVDEGRLTLGLHTPAIASALDAPAPSVINSGS
jgi:small subunit ribosomal protein S1